MSEDNLVTVDPRLVESEQRYRAVIENASDMIQSVRPDGTFEFVNKAWLDKFGYTEEEVQSLNVWDIVHPDAVEHCIDLFGRAISGETIDYMETTFITKAGERLPVEGNVTSRFMGDKVIATHGFFRDISEQLRAQELEARNVQLEREQQARYLEKMAALGKLSAGLAHELNNPAAAAQRASSRMEESLGKRDSAMHTLTGQGFQASHWQAIDRLMATVSTPNPAQNAPDPIRISEQEEIVEEWLDDKGIDRAWDVAPGLVRVGVTDDKLDALAAELPPPTLASAIDWLTETLTIRELTEIIARSSRRISELVQAVKGYSHMDRATEQAAVVHEGLESTLIILGHRLRDVTIVREYQHDLPPVRVFGNTLNQVWTNILDNAIDAMNGKGKITIRTRRENDTVVVEIEDNGAGIPPEDLACIFEPFFTTKPQGQGTGLGLDTVWRIVTEEHGGTIDVTSEPGRTTFRIVLPMLKNEHEDSNGGAAVSGSVTAQATPQAKGDQSMSTQCTHLDQIRDMEPRTPDGCEECMAMGDTWIHLRECLICGHIGCCDSSKNKHATKHFHETGHPIIRSFEPGETWRWCYVDEINV